MPIWVVALLEVEASALMPGSAFGGKPISVSFTATSNVSTYPHKARPQSVRAFDKVDKVAMEPVIADGATGDIDPKNIGRKKIKIQRIEDDRNRQVG